MPIKIKLNEIGKEELDRIGFKSKKEFLEEAVRTYLSARKDLRISLALNLYKDGKISLGRTMELSGLNTDEIKVELARRGIERKTFSSESGKETALKYREK